MRLSDAWTVLAITDEWGDMDITKVTDPASTIAEVDKEKNDIHQSEEVVEGSEGRRIFVFLSLQLAEIITNHIIESLWMQARTANEPKRSYSNSEVLNMIDEAVTTIPSWSDFCVLIGQPTSTRLRASQRKFLHAGIKEDLFSDRKGFSVKWSDFSSKALTVSLE